MGLYCRAAFTTSTSVSDSPVGNWIFVHTVSVTGALTGSFFKRRRASLLSFNFSLAIPFASSGRVTGRVIWRVKSQLRSFDDVSIAADIAVPVGSGRNVAAEQVPPAPPGTLHSTSTATAPGTGLMTGTGSDGVAWHRTVPPTHSPLRQSSPTVH